MSERRERADHQPARSEGEGSTASRSTRPPTDWPRFPPPAEASPPGTVAPPAARPPATRRAPTTEVEASVLGAAGPDAPPRAAAAPATPGTPLAPPTPAGAGHPATEASAAAGTPVVVRSRAELAAALAGLRKRGTVALVPTMGALHAGHRSLLRAARGLADSLLVSIFVNPLQFGPAEDLDRYPRTFDADLSMCREEGVALIFAPAPDVMYGRDAQITVHPGPLGDELEGASRPGHFAGVLTVVAKLFGLLRPDIAVFGEKDYQQLTLIRRMVTDLDLGVRVIGAPTVREPDGMALSSRNAYLSTEERGQAVALQAALRTGAAIGPDGAGAVLRAATATLAAYPGVEVDYIALRSVDLGPAPSAGEARLLVAARVGGTRLIDNTAVILGPVVRA